MSVVIPTFNRAELVVRAAKSVLGQSFRDFEVIVVDDGSTDETAAYVEQLSSIIYIRLPHSGLPAVPRNTGISRASGEYIALLDSDDWWLPGKLERQIGHLEMKPSLGLTCSNALRAGEDDRAYFVNRPSAEGRLFSALLEDNFVIASTVVFRRALLNETGPFCEHRALRASEDYDLWLRLAALADIHYDAEPLAYYRDMPSEGVRGSQGPADSLRGLMHLTQRATRFAGAHGASGPGIEARVRELQRARRRELARILWSEQRRFAALASQIRASWPAAGATTRRGRRLLTMWLRLGGWR